jgi:2,3-bisphosphoglycerate-dependent phosphoglycerate mutase
LIVIRHGESTFNRDRRWQGQSQDAVLSDLGWRQADCVAAALRHASASALISSDLTRSMQTAVPVAAATGLPIYPDARLREISAGRWTNRLTDDVLLEEPDRVAAWNQSPATTSLPDGEGLAEAQARILASVFEHAPDFDGQTVIFATHGAILQTLMAAALGVPLESLWLKTPVPNGGIVHLAWEAGPNGGTLRLVSPPSVEHLAPLGAAGVTLGSAGGPGPVA